MTGLNGHRGGGIRMPEMVMERFPKGFRAYALPDTAAKYVVEYDREEMQKILAHSLTKASAQAAAPPGQV